MPDQMRQQLCMALAHFVGRELNDEVARSIVAMMFPERSIDTHQFEAASYGGLTFRAESMRAIYAELAPLHAAHFAETERARAGLRLNPHLEYIFGAEKAGELLQFTARDDDGKLVGNARFYLYRDLHTGTLAAKEDVYFIAPEWRKGMVAIRFWQYAENCLAQLGVQEVRTDSKILHDEAGHVVRNVGHLNEYLGYTHVANQYLKRLKGAAA